MDADEEDEDKAGSASAPSSKDEHGDIEDDLASQHRKNQAREDRAHKHAQRELEDLLGAAELDRAHDADEQDNGDEDREAADNILIDAPDDEHPELVITGEDIRFAQRGFQKVSAHMLSIVCTARSLTLV